MVSACCGESYLNLQVLYYKRKQKVERAVLQKTVESFFDRDLQSGFSCFGLRRKNKLPGG